MRDVDHIKGLRYGPLGPSALHLCIDMQMMFAHDTPWASGALRSVLPAIEERKCHEAALHGVLPRFDQQVELVQVPDLLGAWEAPALLTSPRE